MAIARYKDLCMDANDPATQAAFWSGRLGWAAHALDDGDACLKDEAGRVQVWINRVPEPVTVKNRLHVDVHAPDLESVMDAGATLIDGESFPWKLMQDPDGQEFCVFVRDDGRFGAYELAWDVTGSAAESRDLAQWWGDLLGAHVGEDPEEGYSYVEQLADAPFEAVVFAPVPEAKTTKNRMHIDVLTDDVAAVLAAGATQLRAKGDDGLRWDVLADPAGNEFCAFTPDD